MARHTRRRRPLWDRIATTLSIAISAAALLGFAALLIAGAIQGAPHA